MVGLLDLFDTRPRDYAEYLDFARSVGQIVAGALENNLLLQDLDRSAEQQRVLVESALEFGASLDVEDVLHSVAVRACAAGAADLCQIALIEDDRVRLLVGVAGEQVGGEASAVLPRAELVAITPAADTRTPRCRYDIETDPDVADDERSACRRRGMRAFACIPLLIGGRAIGVISLFSRRPTRFERLPLLQGLAQIAAHAVANAELHRMLRHRSEQAESLNALARRISTSLDPADITQTTIEELRGLLSFDAAAVVLLDESGSARLACEEPSRDDPGGPAGTIDSPTLRRLRLDGGDPAAGSRSIDAARLDPALLARWPGLRAALVATLHDEGGVFGLLILGRTAAAPYGAVDRETLDRVATHLSLALTNARLYGDIKQLHLANLHALSTALTARDDYTSGHARRVAGYMVLLGHELGWQQRLIEQIEECASLHDIGEIGATDRALFRAGPLGADDRGRIRSHPGTSADILASLFDKDLVAAVRHHHERWDGDGYPAGLSGLEIPLVARAMSVADAYDAMSHRRPYRDALDRQACRAELERCAGAQFDPEMVSAFFNVLDELDRQRAVADGATAAVIAYLSPDGRVPAMADHATDADHRHLLTAHLRSVRDAHPLVHRLVLAVPRHDGPDDGLAILAG
ncbi:MAG: GAF domain-containing protein, partial [Actinobacteria bacterium]|nr:GAF domain-containing protein [Actinomycetota bacterium]